MKYYHLFLYFLVININIYLFFIIFLNYYYYYHHYFYYFFSHIDIYIHIVTKLCSPKKRHNKLLLSQFLKSQFLLKKENCN